MSDNCGLESQDGYAPIGVVVLGSDGNPITYEGNILCVGPNTGWYYGPETQVDSCKAGNTEDCIMGWACNPCPSNLYNDGNSLGCSLQPTALNARLIIPNFAAVPGYPDNVRQYYLIPPSSLLKQIPEGGIPVNNNNNNDPSVITAPESSNTWIIIGVILFILLVIILIIFLVYKARSYSEYVDLDTL